MSWIMGTVGVTYELGVYAYAFASSSIGSSTLPMPTSRSACTCTMNLAFMPRPTPQLLQHFTPIPTPTSSCVYFNLCSFNFDINSENDADLTFFTFMFSLTPTLTPCLHPPRLRFKVPIAPTGWKSHVSIPLLAGVISSSSSKEGPLTAHSNPGTLRSDSTFNQPTHTVRLLIRIGALIPHHFRPSPRLPHFQLILPLTRALWIPPQALV